MNSEVSNLNPELITLSDGRPGLRNGLTVEIREPSPSEGPAVLDFIASSEALDRCGEIIVAGGWRLEAYRRNPIFQNAHQYGDIIFTLGKALVTEVRDNRLYQRIQFAVAVNPMARIAYGLYRGGFLNAVSVGFIPLRWENGGPGDSFRRRYLEQELLEVSAVGIPANQEALRLGLKSGAFAEEELRRIMEELETLESAKPSGLESDGSSQSISNGSSTAPDTDVGASGVPGSEAPLLRLARDVRRLFRRG